MSDILGPSLKERDRRWELTRKFLEEKGLEALIIFPSHRGFDHYLSNFHIFPDGCTVILPLKSEPVVHSWFTGTFSNVLERSSRGLDIWIPDVRGGITVSEFVVSVLREKGIENSSIGVVGLGLAGPWAPQGYVPYQTWVAIEKELPKTDFIEVGIPYSEVMLVKSDEELRLIERAAEIGNEAAKKMIETIQPGISEMEIYAAGMNVFNQYGARAEWMIIQSGPANSAWGQPWWLTCAEPIRKIKDGDIIMAELFPHYGMLEAQLQLCVGVGSIDPINETAAEIARRSYELGLATIKPGITFREVCEAMKEPYNEHEGAWHLTPLIHSLNPLMLVSQMAVGVEKYLPGAELYKGVRGMDRITGADMIIKPNMIFELEPNCHFSNHRVNIGGTVVVTENGAKELNPITNKMVRI